METYFEKLKAQNEPDWTATVTHRFVRELGAGTVDNAVMSRYLIQDHRFIDNFLGLLGGAICCADRFSSRLTLGRFTGMISSEENDYFLRSFQALCISVDERLNQPDSEATQAMKAIMLEAARSGSYAAALSVLTVAESIYLDWGMSAPEPYPDNFLYTEWITLHNSAYFISFVDFLKQELDRIGPDNDSICQDFFKRTVQLEKAFFDDAYA